ncbi:integrating conjugative element protein (plasmid) [Vibrio azureus]|uniref:Integrating conjugative element protein n=1 Tax=Vibrio azureus NBRC 104587 TaxID=1219077 RepID=U3CCX8_9VIBR|nr:TIGR03752 family integrating conjugative element protein [Vibrio azureus]AUI88932.1 integrating conjugative element protein [Vibrio azureus]GAD76198.1 hypothetical protein VAZ01S_039_00230 [Vibrio azureus NBRC 104587]
MIKSNPLIKVAAVAGTFVFVIVMVGLFRDGEAKVQSDDTNDNAPLTVTTDESQAQALQAFNDTPVDTIRTLNVAYQKSERDKVQLTQELEKTQQQMALQQQQSQQKVSAMETQLSELATRLNASLDTIENKFNEGHSSLRDHQQNLKEQWGELGLSDEQLATGTSNAFPSHYAQSHQVKTSQGNVANAGDMVWTHPMDATQDDKGQWILPDSQAIKSSVKQLQSFGQNFDDRTFDANQKKSTPIYTLHRGAILANAVSLTALMGRVPHHGKVTDPYPFSMIVGRQNLLANGFTLPEIQGAIVTGTVTGDWSLSCVRGVVESIDFIRQDGSILSFPEAQDQAIDSGFDGSTIKTQDLGFFADVNGNPCLNGQRISNAPEYLTTKGLLDATTAAAQAVAISQKTLSVDGGTSTATLTGSAAKNAVAESGAALSSTVSDFIQGRMGASFDIIYTPPNTVASIHIRKPITLSAPKEAVKVRYQTANQGGHYALP